MNVLLVALAIVMMGLELTISDFIRVTKHKAVVFLALFLQVIALPSALYCIMMFITATLFGMWLNRRRPDLA